MQTEHVILLNAQGVPTGTLEKYAAHTADTRLHLAFSSWLFNAKGQLLVTRLYRQPPVLSGCRQVKTI